MRAPDTLTSPRLRARRPLAADLPYVIATDSDWAIQATTSGAIQTLEQSHARMKKWLALWNEHGFGFWIFTDEAGNDVGHAGLFVSSLNPSEIELGYALKPAYWGCGYGTEMASAVLRVGFDVLDMRKIIAVIQPQNRASRHIAEKCGLALAAEFIHIDGNPRVCYAIDHTQWRGLRGTAR